MFMPLQVRSLVTIQTDLHHHLAFDKNLSAIISNYFVSLENISQTFPSLGKETEIRSPGSKVTRKGCLISRKNGKLLPFL